MCLHNHTVFSGGHLGHTSWRLWQNPLSKERIPDAPQSGAQNKSPGGWWRRNRGRDDGSGLWKWRRACRLWQSKWLGWSWQSRRPMRGRAERRTITWEKLKWMPLPREVLQQKQLPREELEQALKAPRLERALEWTLKAPGLEWVHEWALRVPGLKQALEWTLR